MTDCGQLTDATDQEWERCMLSQEQEQWLCDENAQREYQLWLDTLHNMNRQGT